MILKAAVANFINLFASFIVKNFCHWDCNLQDVPIRTRMVKFVPLKGATPCSECEILHLKRNCRCEMENMQNRAFILVCANNISTDEKVIVLI